MSSAHSLLSCHINFAFKDATSHSYHFIKYLGLYFVNKALSVCFCSSFWMETCLYWFPSEIAACITSSDVQVEVPVIFWRLLSHISIFVVIVKDLFGSIWCCNSWVMLLNTHHGRLSCCNAILYVVWADIPFHPPRILLSISLPIFIIFIFLCNLVFF